MKGNWLAPVALGLMLAAFLPPLWWRLVVMDEAELIITPAWERRVLALAIVTALIPATALIVAAVRRTLRPWVVLPLVFLTAVGVVGGAALMTVLEKNFIFPDKLLRLEHAEGEDLYLYDASFLSCTLTVYAAKPGAQYARRVATENVGCGQRDTVRARRAADGGVEIYHATP